MTLLAINWNNIILVTLVGFGVVFCILVLLIAVITLFGKVMAPKAKVTKTTTTGSGNATVKVEKTEEDEEDEDSEEEDVKIMDDVDALEGVSLEDPVRMYLKEIGSVRLLTPEEEVELSKRAKAGDQEARDRIIEANLRLVVSIAKKYVGRAPQQVTSYLKNVVNPMLEANREVLGYTSEINV